MARQAYLDQETKSLLYWSPKAGCTSLVQWFVFGRLGKETSEIRQNYADARGWLRGEGYRLDFREARKLIREEGYKSIVMARHPATRVLSAYLNKFVVYHGKPINAWERHEKAIRGELHRWDMAGPNGDGFNGLSFRSFLDKIEEKVAEATKQKEPQLDGHWNTQMPLAYARTGFGYDKVLYLEASGETFKWLNGYFDVDYKMPATNRTKYSEETETIDATNMLSYTLSAHPEYLKKENFLHEDILQQIARIYRTDYKALGYDPMDITKVPDTPAEAKAPAKVPAKARAKAPAKPRVKAPANAKSRADFENAPPFEIHDKGAAKTVVAFGGLALELGMPVFEFRKALSNLECNFVFFRDVCRSWYHHDIKGFGENFEAKGVNMKAILGRLAETELYTLGSSAGGFAALMFSAFLKPKSTLLFGPQVFIDNHTRHLLADNRWHRLINAIEADRYRSVADVADRISHPVHFIVGNEDDLDIRHALYAKAFVDARIMVLTGGKHNPARGLKAAGILHKVLEDFVNDREIEEHPALKMPGRKAELMRL